MLIRMGFPRAVVAFLGRWGSDAILKYVEEVTAVGVALDLPTKPADPFEEVKPAEVGRPAGTSVLAERSRPEEEAGLPVIVPAAGQTKPDTPFPRVGNTFRSREEVMGAEGSLEEAHCPPGPFRSPPGGKRRGRKVLPTAVALAEAPPWQELDGQMVRGFDASPSTRPLAHLPPFAGNPAE